MVNTCLHCLHAQQPRPSWRLQGAGIGTPFQAPQLIGNYLQSHEVSGYWMSNQAMAVVKNP